MDIKEESVSSEAGVDTGSTEIKIEKSEPKEMAMEQQGNDSETTELQKKIIRQIEYYFSDYSLPKDKFLQEQIKLDEEGWVPLTTMTKFKRLAELTTNHQAILEALKKSTSGLLEINQESEKIRRSKDKPLPEDTDENKQLLKARTVYCKGFPRQTTIDKILEFFNAHEGVENVKMRYITDKEEKSSFKGSITINFSSKELAEKFMKLEEVKYNDHALLRQWVVDWEKEKEEQYKSKKNKNKKSQDSEEKKDGESKENEKIKLAKNAVLKLVNLPEKVQRDEIKEAFASYPADIAHVEGPTDNTAFVRLRGDDDGKTVLGKLEDGKITIKSTVVEVTLLEGDEEEEYLKKVLERISSAAANKGGRGRGRGWGGRGRGRGRGGWRGQKRSGSPSGFKGNKKVRNE